ncbi:MAG TPA: DUF5131 family protein [Verrucomicrobiae bacterium]|nr:DUF5131 family protein [Verrucomicrobiae bacterium]
MSETTKIQWADHTGSPWYVCTEVNEDCADCYAKALSKGRMRNITGGNWGKGAPRVRAKAFWTDALKWNKNPWVCDLCGKSYPMRGMHPDCDGEDRQMHRARMFPSLCDWLDEEAPIEWLADFLKVVEATQNLIWMLLTKRPELWRERLEAVSEFCSGKPEYLYAGLMVDLWLANEPQAPQNVWIFVSAGNQKNADVMIPRLVEIPAVIHGVSAEPLIGPIDFESVGPNSRTGGGKNGCTGGFVFNSLTGEAPYYRESDGEPCIRYLDSVDMVIFGGESTQGKPARACNIEDIRSGVQQCRECDVKAYVKQMGSNAQIGGIRVPFKDKKGGDMEEWPKDLRVREWPEGAYQ